MMTCLVLQKLNVFQFQIGIRHAIYIISILNRQKTCYIHRVPNTFQRYYATTMSFNYIDILALRLQNNSNLKVFLRQKVCFTKYVRGKIFYRVYYNNFPRLFVNNVIVLV